MAGVNKVILVGRLGKDPVSRKMPNGSSVVSFSVATSEEWKDKNTGEKQSKTEWHNIVVFSKLADVCATYLFKGAQVYVEGRLQTRSWEKDGVKQYTTEIVANTVQFLGERKDQQAAPQGQISREDLMREFGGKVVNNNDDDIPF